MLHVNVRTVSGEVLEPGRDNRRSYSSPNAQWTNFSLAYSLTVLEPSQIKRQHTHIEHSYFDIVSILIERVWKGMATTNS